MGHGVGSSSARQSRRRFTIAMVAAGATTAIPFCWILWSLWGSPHFLRTTIYESNFYDLQTRAMFHGHLWLANGAIGIEAFVHGGHQYTYFGLFPSILRMPLFALTSRYDGKLSGPSILAAWIGTGVFSALLLWRVRLFVRGRAVLGRVEATAYGVVMATFMGGTIFMLLAATPFVFNEDIAWSICLTVGSLFCLLGVLERPSWGRIAASFVLVLAANLDRATTGWACVVGAVLIAGWFALGRAGPQNRRWCLPVLGVGLVPLVISCAVNYSKFGVLFGVSNYEQVWTHVNAYRRRFLAANHNAEEGIIFVPTNVMAYLRPDGLRLTSVFPFITLPSGPPRPLSGVLFDRTYRTASLPASSPLLFLLACWGLVTAFRPRAVGKVALTRLLLLAAGAGGAALLLWGYIAPRYLGDFVPFLILASAVALADIWRRLERRNWSIRIGALAVLAVVAVFSIAANVGVAITPNEEWGRAQLLSYVQTQKSFSDLLGLSLNSNVVRGRVLPAWGRADQLFVVGNCEGLYISNGEDYSTVPSEQLQRATWMTVQLGHAFDHAFELEVHRSSPGTTTQIPLVTAGANVVSVSATSHGPGGPVGVRFGYSWQGGHEFGPSFNVRPDSSVRAEIVTDPVKRVVNVSVGSTTYLAGSLANGRPIHSDVASSRSAAVSSPVLAALDVTNTLPNPTLCENILHG